MKAIIIEVNEAGEQKVVGEIGETNPDDSGVQYELKIPKSPVKDMSLTEWSTPTVDLLTKIMDVHSETMTDDEVLAVNNTIKMVREVFKTADECHAKTNALIDELDKLDNTENRLHAMKHVIAHLCKQLVGPQLITQAEMLAIKCRNHENVEITNEQGSIIAVMFFAKTDFATREDAVAWGKAELERKTGKKVLETSIIVNGEPQE